MNDMTILHLSDLHIDTSGISYSRLLHKLIDDIQKEIQYVRNNSVIVVVTGDILHQGPLKSKNSSAVEHAKEFFNDLHMVLVNKVVGIYIVPGNHDKYRSEKEKFLIPAYRTMEQEYKNLNGKICSKFNLGFFENFWEHHLESYKQDNGTGYIELIKEIYNIFGMSNDVESKSFVKNTFGVDVVEIFGRKYCFVLLNTAWSCLDDEDNRNIILGEFQINMIKEQFQQLVSRREMGDDIDLTIVIGHHPLGALSGKEEDRMFSEMISFEGLDANVYLCGHTHDRTVNNWVNNRHSINTFVTGIGWPETSNSSHVGDHTYSMYIFNMNANSVDVYVRSTHDDGSFFPDFRIYTSKQYTDRTKLVFPIQSQNAQTYIPLSVGDSRSSKAYYISKEFMESIKDYMKRMEQFREVIGEKIAKDKSEVFESVDIDDKINEISEINEIDELLYNYFIADLANESEQIRAEVSKVLKRNDNLLFDMFLGFLQTLCHKMSEILLEGKCDENDIVRFHFRFLADKKSFRYLQLCTSFYEKDEQSQHSVSEIEYGQLIEKSYEGECSLIYSCNEEFSTNKLKEKWKNFITVVPLFDKNNFLQKKQVRVKKIPYLTFGVTTNNEKFDELLYCMDYFSIKQTLEEVISRYIDTFCIDIDKFCGWAKNTLQRGESSSEKR
ncbi:MAG: metallophosphoesterase [Ruminococcus flavefaciens]|nr:metallophosphoesterase [Ruminococcus flavefaciens]